jgi:aldehyde dehydrogenase (NAD+)
MGVARADVGAPVISVLTATSVDDAVALANASPYALGASVFGRRRDAEAVAARLAAPTVTVNDLIAPTADPRVPFGGSRQSGFGVTRGPDGLLALTRPKVVLTRRGRARHLDLAKPGDDQLLLHVLRAAHGRTLADRLRALTRVVTLGARRGK